MPACPWEIDYLWQWFQRLDATRQPAVVGQSGMVGECGITEQEMRAFFLNRRITPQPWEVELLASLDALALQPPDRK